MTMFRIAAAAGAAVLAAGSAQAVTIVTVEAAGVQTTTIAGSTAYETFDAVPGYTSPYVTSFGGSSFTGTFSSVLPGNADPYGGAGGIGRYETVQGTTVLTVTGGTDYFGLWASALDGGNAVAFYSGGNLVDTISLVSVPLDNSYAGNPNANFLGQNAGERYAFFNFVVIGGYDEVRFIQNTGGGFELDNVTVGTVTMVPEPASWAMLIAGFGLTGAVMRRRRRVVA